MTPFSIFRRVEHVSVSCPSGDKEATIALLGEGDFMGEDGITSDQASACCVHR